MTRRWAALCLVSVLGLVGKDALVELADDAHHERVDDDHLRVEEKGQHQIQCEIGQERLGVGQAAREVAEGLSEAENHKHLVLGDSAEVHVIQKYPVQRLQANREARKRHEELRLGGLNVQRVFVDEQEV